MRRRDIPKILLASTAASALGVQQAQAQTCNEPCYPRTQAEIDVQVTPTNYAYVPGDVRRYWVANNARASIQTAVNVIGQTGGVVYIPAGTYVIDPVAALDGKPNGIVVPFSNIFGYQNHVTLKGDGRATVLLAGDNGMTVIRWSDSYGRLQDLAIDNNGKSGVTGLSLISSNTGNPSLAEHIDWNTISRLDIAGCAEGIEMESPSAGGCYYNQFEHCTLYNNVRHIRMRDNQSSGGANRNIFVGVTLNGGNTGVWIDGADTTRFIACSFEDIAVGTTPSASPAAVHITNVGSLRGLSSADTSLIACVWENCTRDLNCNNRRVSIVGGNCGAVGAITGSAAPDMVLGGDEEYHLREVHLGSQIDGLLMQPRQIAFTPHPQVATSSDQSLAYPFNADGHLILQSRENAIHDILFVTGSPSTPRARITGTGHLLPASDAAANLGSGTSRWNQIFAANGTISTSDAREKTTRGVLNQAELRVARRIARLPLMFQWNESLAEKGEQARLHCGVLAQDVREAFLSEGLEPDRYAMNCADEVADSNGERIIRYSLRYSELATFVMVAQEQRIAALEEGHEARS